jgi:CBS domain-containing protein/sporulation protein YlmC with PRC-barrel domain
LALSDLESMTVVDADDADVGELIDVVADMSADPPLVSAFFILHDDEQLAASWAQVAAIDAERERLRLGVPLERVKAAALRADELALVDAVLDKQVLDMRDRRFVRVQDVILELRGGRLVVTGVDASSGAVMRRMGLGFFSKRLPRKAGDMVPWEDVNLITLRLSHLNFVEAFAEVADMHPADLADVISQVGPRERAAVLGALNARLAADTLQEMEPDVRTAALMEMPVARAVAVLAEIDPDEAADALAKLPGDLAEQLLAGLPRREADTLRDLASHPEHSAGALMTTDFVTMAQGLTAAQALQRIRAEKPEEEALAIVFVLDDEGRLAGTISLGDLVLADPESLLTDVMEHDPVTVAAGRSEEEVARLMTHYNLLALPVVDEQGCLEGIVTLDDALEALLPEEWKQRLPRLFR